MPSRTTMPLWLSALLVVGVPTAIAMFGPYFVRRLVPLKTLSTNNEVAGFKFAVVGVLYAVLLAFAVIVVWGTIQQLRSSGCRRGWRRGNDLPSC